ncbi:putative bifunctional diguanylate cyclase/phosphodiesterase [Marinobacter sp. X15-166B]|uniref:putative bifunctional diguanylate cyclase/phosphodiesterase n=1 Tax=Marinobacter sp. X15-166B TaxID=1897620 RepID=UPI00085C4F11|nr:sensor domain-containing phosphodiesterase [Marinobacter sp. X15-166B]OEY66947.1 diguanylate cyclase [Marinobacter sp. X15-166B]
MSDKRAFIRFHEKLMKLSHDPEFTNSTRPEKLAALCHLCATQLQVDRVSVWRFNYGRDHLLCEHLFDRQYPNGAPKAPPWKRDEYPAYFARLTHARVIDIQDVYHTPLFQPLRTDYFRSLGIHSMLDAPVFYGSRPSGVVCLESRSTWRWQLAEFSFAMAIADIVSLLNTHEAWTDSKRKLDHVRYYDRLTGLPNLESLRNRIGYLTQKIKRRGSGQFALFWINLDRMKIINEGIGASVGDLVINEVAHRLADTPLLGKDLFAHLGGDEFVLILRTYTRPDALLAAARILQKTIKQPIHINDQPINLSAGIGVCRFPEDGTEPPTLLRQAEAAMYSAKNRGVAQLSLFDDSIQATAQSRFALERELHTAIKNHQLEVFYQPIFERSGTRMASAEALVRWHHPHRGWLTPATFLDIARGAGLMYDLGECVIRRVCEHLRDAKIADTRLPVISVNLSAEQVQSPGLPALVAALCAEYGVAHRQLHFEVTEDSIQDASETVRNTLDQLVRAGSELAIDDFGTGYSSLSRLKALPFTKLKIDQSFISDIPYDEDDCAITQSIFGLARGLAMSVIAEGVETREHESWLQVRGCEFLQGFRYSEPVPLDTLITEFL